MKTIEQEMNKYFLQLGTMEKKSIVQLIKTLVKSRNEKPERISIEQYNKEIDETMEEVANGKFLSHDEVIRLTANL